MATERYRLSDGTVTESAAEFRDHCLRLVDELIECGGQLSVSVRHEPSVLLAAWGPLKPLPWENRNSRSGQAVEIAGDLDRPLFSDEEVDAFLERELENIYGPREERVWQTATTS